MTTKEILEILREKLKKGESIPENILNSITPEILKELPPLPALKKLMVNPEYYHEQLI